METFDIELDNNVYNVMFREDETYLVELNDRKVTTLIPNIDEYQIDIVWTCDIMHQKI
jgi:uncharacterized membrane protein YvbJ